jgi:RHS repeat-associated protein
MRGTTAPDAARELARSLGGYDANGNLKSDGNKGILNITYNYLNLPTRIQFTGDAVIEFTYDATGRKLKKFVSSSERKDWRYYVDGIEYQNEHLDLIHHSEGSVRRDADGKFQHHFVLRDHLGNTRVTFSDLNNNDTINEKEEMIQINNYYAFGLNMEGNWNGATGANKYQYNGKELNDDLGLNWNDYGARFYDPAMARWQTVDPLAGKYSRWSPYNYVMDNPMNCIDPTGMEGQYVVPDLKSGNSTRWSSWMANYSASNSEDVLALYNTLVNNGQNQTQPRQQITITVTSEPTGTAKLVSAPGATGESAIDYYYNVSTFKMTVTVEDFDGEGKLTNTASTDFNVLRYGVKKLNEAKAKAYYQGFGATGPGKEPKESRSYSINTFRRDDTYQRGCFPIIYYMEQWMIPKQIQQHTVAALILVVSPFAVLVNGHVFLG